MGKVEIAKTKLMQNYKWVVAPHSQYCQNHFFFDLLPACECLAGYAEGTAEVMSVREWVNNQERGK